MNRFLHQKNILTTEYLSGNEMRFQKDEFMKNVWCKRNHETTKNTAHCLRCRYIRLIGRPFKRNRPIHNKKLRTYLYLSLSHSSLIEPFSSSFDLSTRLSTQHRSQEEELLFSFIVFFVFNISNQKSFGRCVYMMSHTIISLFFCANVKNSRNSVILFNLITHKKMIMCQNFLRYRHT